MSDDQAGWPPLLGRDGVAALTLPPGVREPLRRELLSALNANVRGLRRLVISGHEVVFEVRSNVAGVLSIFVHEVVPPGQLG